jgi:hypothetical protein
VEATRKKGEYEGKQQEGIMEANLRVCFERGFLIGRMENMRVSSRRAATLGLSQASFQGLRIAESCPCLEHNPFPQHIRGRLL